MEYTISHYSPASFQKFNPLSGSCIKASPLLTLSSLLRTLHRPSLGKPLLRSNFPNPILFVVDSHSASSHNRTASHDTTGIAVDLVKVI
jgi:hypothetical protein